MDEQKRAELLSPCGNFDCVKAAVNNGADAVYLGGRLFNARAYASNFDDETLEQVCDLCHSYQVKVYVTVNTLYKDEEFEALVPFIDGLYAMGVDGLIMQDLGAISLVRKYWPELPVHASTQLTANSLDDVKAFEAMGLTTAVLSRELNIREISHIAANSKIRIETFIHGALCVSYSGQCLMSSVLGNRSGNRGRCAQNCRLCYDLLCDREKIAQGHLLSTKDICTLPLLPDLLRTGVASLKIEGRMKSPEYVAGVTGIYRKYLDLFYSGARYEVDPDDILVLQQLFNRGAFSRGYLKTHSGMEMMCPTHPKHWGVYAGRVLSYDRKKQLAAIRFEKNMIPGDGIEIRTEDEEGAGTYLNKPSEAGKKVFVPIRGEIRENQEVWQTYDKRLMDTLKPRYETITRKVPLEAQVTLRAGQPAQLRLTAAGETVEINGEVPSAALNQPLTAESVREQIGKLGNTIFRAEQIDADVEDGLYLNKSSLNSLRNTAIDLLQNMLISLKKSERNYPVVLPPDTDNSESDKSLSVFVKNKAQFKAVLRCNFVKSIYVDMNDTLMKDIHNTAISAHNLNKLLHIKLPRIWRDYIKVNISDSFKLCHDAGIDGWLINNLGHYQAVKESGKPFALDISGNVMNSRSYEFWQSLGAESIGLSVEMSREEINRLADRSRAEILAYGRLPLMVTHQCPIGNFAGKKQNSIHCAKYGHPEKYTLRCGKDSFHLDTDCKNCLCTIQTTEPIDIRENINSFKVKTFRLNFDNEDYETTSNILKKYENILAGKVSSNTIVPNIYDKSVL
ncbi:MAG: U32 family peptidase [Flexilinea sp.]|nr:U32 family peptidase [Flexilinea sp.]